MITYTTGNLPFSGVGFDSRFWAKTPPSGGFFNSGISKKWEEVLRTIIYVDGFNLYYSVLTGSAYKWLDIHELFAHRIIIPAEPSSEIVQTKFFTSPILGKFSTDPESPHRQVRYHNALKARHPELLEIILGYHSPKITNAYHADPANGTDQIKVQVMEEKQTDVNIGVHMYRDTARSAADQLVLVSNDSDLAPALEIIRKDYTQLKIGIIFPAYSHRKGSRRSGRLKQLADWTRDYLRVDELEQCQLPETLQNRKNRTLRKPEKW